MTISRVKFPWPPFFRIFIFFDEVFNLVCGTTYLMRDDGATVVNVRSSRVIAPPPSHLSAGGRRGRPSYQKNGRARNRQRPLAAIVSLLTIKR